MNFLKLTTDPNYEAVERKTCINKNKLLGILTSRMFSGSRLAWGYGDSELRRASGPSRLHPGMFSSALDFVQACQFWSRHPFIGIFGCTSF
jgi:hypothetical protein